MRQRISYTLIFPYKRDRDVNSAQNCMQKWSSNFVVKGKYGKKRTREMNIVSVCERERGSKRA